MSEPAEEKQEVEQTSEVEASASDEQPATVEEEAAAEATAQEPPQEVVAEEAAPPAEAVVETTEEEAAADAAAETPEPPVEAVVEEQAAAPEEAPDKEESAEVNEQVEEKPAEPEPVLETQESPVATEEEATASDQTAAAVAADAAPSTEESQAAEEAPPAGDLAEEASDEAEAAAAEDEDNGEVEAQKSPAKRISPRDNEGEGGNEPAEQSASGELEQPAIPADFFYDAAEFASKPSITAESGLPEDLLQLAYSYGYDCTKRDNLHILDAEHVCFVAGNLVKVVNLSSKRQTFIRSSSGGAVGSVAVHPSRQYLAVAEKGQAPNVLVYEYPSLKLYRILRGGTEKAYSNCKFDPHGKYLATVGSEPDFMLTIWDWLSERTVLRSKAFSQDVFRVSWSQDLEGFLTTAGTGHIRFWKMASTFTGLKLQGAIGKFGKTEISDIEGFVELPDGKVLSGCEWGNMLVWDGGLIKVEIAKKGKRRAHNGPIFQVVMDAGELMTVGIDGLIQTWDFEMIDTAEAVDESGQVEMEPMNAYEVGNNVRLAHIVKQVASSSAAAAAAAAEDEGSSEWLAQDSNGGIWRLDLSFSHTAQPPERLLSCHAGAIAGCAASPLSYLVATLGTDGSVRVTDFAAQRTLVESRFSGAGTRVVWAPQTVDPKGRTILAGFADGVIRVLSFGENPETDPTRKAKQVAELTLVEALKPHSGRVVDIVLDQQGDMLATTGIEHESSHPEEQRSSIFFFTVSASKYSPVGFIKFQGYPAQLAWLPATDAKSADRVRVFLADGRVCDFDCPDPAKIDTSVTYELSGFEMRQRFAFASVKSKLRRAEELEEIHRKEAEEMKRRVEERKRKLERGLQSEEEQAKEIEEEEKELAKRRAEEQQWEPYYPEEPSPILCGLVARTEPDAFWLSMGGFDSGYLYRCDYPEAAPADFESAKREPGRSVPVADSDDVPITLVTFSRSGKRAFFGMQDGSVRVQLLEAAFDLGSMTSQWRLPMHDNEYGAVTGLCPSHDDAYLISVGSDGNYFVYQVMPEDIQEQLAEEARAAKLPSAKRVQRGDDIDDPGAYSIEEDKQKSEHDRRVKLAEEKKAGIRRRVNELRVEFRKLKELNQALPERIQLRQREFEMVPQLKLDMQEQRKQKVKLLERELAWESERCQIALNKLRSRFLDELECELLVVRAIDSDHEVASIRTARLSEAFNRLKEEMERKRTLASQKDATRDATLLSAKETTQEALAEKEEESQLFKSNLKGARGERILRQLRKVEEKKRKRAQRRQEREELEQGKPSDDYDDPEDVRAIQEARDNMGDFKLKSADDYVVPPHLRLSSDKARQKLIDLDEKTYKHKSDFNRRLLQLRDRKKQLVQELNGKLQQLEAIQMRLQPEERKPLPPRLEMHASEIPEKKYEYTPETLMEFKAEMEAKAAVVATGEEEQGFAAFKKAAGINNLAPPGAAAAAGISGTLGGASSSALTGGGVDGAESVADKSLTGQLSELQAERLAAENLRSIYAQDQLLREIKSAVRNFDCEVRLLRHEKFELDAKLKRAELRQITLFEEFQLLQQFEISESTLANRVEQRGEEKVDVQNKVVDCTAKIEAKKKDIDRVLEKDRALFDAFKESLGEGNKFTEYLTKVYRKRIKRKKVEKEGDAESDAFAKIQEGEDVFMLDADDESESESDDDSDFESEEEESDGEGVRYDLDICPAGCDQALYDNTCALREKRLDLEEELAEERKTMEALRKELEGLQKKSRAVETALAQAEKELEAFQLEKQSKLNELETVVVLRLHQILHHESGHLPQDISNCLVFERSALLQLKRRINELQEEKHQQNREQKEAKRKNIQLNKDRRLYQAHIDDLMEKSDKMMVDKFGKVEDMEKLEQIVINPKIEELTVKMFEQQEKMLDEMNQWDDKIRDAKDHLISQTKDNTKKLTQMLMLYNDQYELEQQIQSRQRNLGSEYQGAREADIEEIEKLMQLVQIQAQELNALKEEIGMLSRKGGHILPPVQPPMQGPL